jgi:hypothetical protein
VDGTHRLQKTPASGTITGRHFTVLLEPDFGAHFNIWAARKPNLLRRSSSAESTIPPWGACRVTNRTIGSRSSPRTGGMAPRWPRQTVR